VDSRDPGRSRAALLLECAVLLLVIWVPLTVGPRVADVRAVSKVALFELYELVVFLGMIALIHFMIWRNGESFRHLAWRPVKPHKEVLWAVVVLLAARTAAVLDYALFGPYAGDPNAVPPELKGLTVLVLLSSAVFEEAFYRGYLWNRFRRLSRSPGLTLIATSVFFAAAHPYPLRDLLSVFGFGLVMGLFRLQGRSLTRLILAHWTFNLLLYTA
jgi:uncharacterized protein